MVRRLDISRRSSSLLQSSLLQWSPRGKPALHVRRHVWGVQSFDRRDGCLADAVRRRSVPRAWALVLQDWTTRWPSYGPAPTVTLT